ncbi:MAG: N-acetylmuramoyl-L-alanine amidase [Cytophagales bacterium]|nr:N-acetylmuramoyl-L-alanine amidase [Cytophagales bacterium]MDW8384771.1 N-acetylmuramoyl-L-alanine amidase [Flammeovirgaceae bacterium]
MFKAYIKLCIWGIITSVTFGLSWAQRKEIVIVLDPGHGGKDPGKDTKTPGMKHEKDINLKVALKLGKYLSDLQGVRVIYTRTEDVFISLEDRVYIANTNKADYFISLHCNSNPNKKVFGTKTHIHSHYFKTSRELALRIEKEFATRAGRTSGGVQSAYDRGENLYVVQYTNMPSVLIEMGFLSNPKEEKFLNSERGQDIIASAIFRAVRDFIHREEIPTEDRSTVYRVQVKASVAPLDGGDKIFSSLGMKVEEIQVDSGVFRYKYVVGREYDRSSAQKLLEKVHKKGIKDAFIIEVKEKQ